MSDAGVGRIPLKWRGADLAMYYAMVFLGDSRSSGALRAGRGNGSTTPIIRDTPPATLRGLVLKHAWGPRSDNGAGPNPTIPD
jgi:hypothetical protein